MDVFDFIIDLMIELLSTPAILIAIFVMIGLMIKKKGIADIIKGVVKTILGFHLVSAGASVVVGSLGPLNTMMSTAFGFTGVVPQNEVCYATAQTTYGQALAGIIVLAMLINLIIARFTKFSFIYLTGHEMMWVSTCCAVIFSALNLPLWQIIIGGGLATGMYMALFPALVYKDVCRVTDSKDLSIAHTGSALYWVAARFSALVGKGSKSAEELELPKSLNFLRDLNVSLSLAMFIIYFVTSIVVAIGFPGTIEEVFGGANLVIGSIEYSIEFTAGVYILMAGVRLMVGEIVPGFQGIAQKFIPNAVPALDIPIVYPYQPNSVLLGFLSCSAAFITAFLVQAATASITGLAVILPSLMNAFFFGATYGSIANPVGGRRGVVISSFIIGFITQFVPALTIKFGGVLVEGTTFAGVDSMIISTILNQFGNIVGTSVFYIVVAAFICVFIFGRRKGKKEGIENA